MPQQKIRSAPQQVPTPTVFVLFGATGDLTDRMVLPAFYDLFCRGLTPPDWVLIGNGRGDVAHEDFAGRGSDRWVDMLVAWGSDDAVRARVEEHFTAGANHVALQVLSSEPAPHLPLPEIRAAAGVFLTA